MRDGKIHICEIGVGRIDVAFGALYWHDPKYFVSMFEPHPIYFRMLNEAGGYKDNVELNQVAIGKEKGVVKLYDRATSSYLETLDSPFEQDQNTKKEDDEYFMVQVDTFDKYDKGDIDHLRIDTEGGEYFVLEKLISKPSQIVLETHNHIGSYINPYLCEIEEWMEANNYYKINVDSGDSIFQLHEDSVQKRKFFDSESKDLNSLDPEEIDYVKMATKSIKTGHSAIEENNKGFDTTGQFNLILKNKEKTIQRIADYIEKKVKEGRKLSDLMEIFTMFGIILQKHINDDIGE